ncbi:hypothetical protein F7725_025922 [Dissostichus mawsoni]|uniref:Small ribosomal subunit protein uS11m n=1 Tax=Dissostichus mawsoni TaxID=36200 RepID=A0A7J5X6G4_DISMA|nr:hypothetical protein F7725_025922 [Dissostichus mawsoni]
MYKLNCILVSSVSTVCRQLAASVNANVEACLAADRLFQCPQTSGGSFQHRGQKTSSKDFSIFPPMPGYDSSLRWGGRKFEELPIVHVKATYNNTHIQLTESGGQSLVRTSCGTEGFKNIKKSTPVAAQTAGISAAAKASEKGVTFVRVVIKGIGPGRWSAIQGLTMGGLQVVSITDNTPVAELHVLLAAFLLGEERAEGVEFGFGGYRCPAMSTS